MERVYQEAFSVIYNSYIKILKINLTLDNYSIIKLNETERVASKKISEWFSIFANSELLFEEDREDYKNKTDIGFLKNYFKDNSTLGVKYRRLINNEYKWVLMELTRGEDYSFDNEVIFVYVRNMNDSLADEIKAYQGLEHYCNYDSLTELKNFFAYKNECMKYAEHKNPYVCSCSVGALFCDLNGLKIINDTKGHDAGNDYICSFSDILKSIFKDDSIYRLSGDEFVILMVNKEESYSLSRFLSLKETIAEDKLPMAAVGYDFQQVASHIEDVVKAAEIDMYADKSKFYKLHPELKRVVFEEEYNREIEAIVKNISRAYQTLGIIDTRTDTYRLLKADDTILEATNGKSFTEYVSIFMNKLITTESRNSIANYVGIDNLKSVLKNQESFSFNFQMRSGVWRHITYRKLEEIDNEPVKILFYAQRMGKYMSQEMEKNKIMTRDYELLEGLSIDFSMISMIDGDSGKIELYSNNEVPEKIIDIISNNFYKDVVASFSKDYVAPEDKVFFNLASDFQHISSKLKESSKYSFNFKMKIKDKEMFLRLLYYKPFKDSENIVLAVKDITKDIKHVR